jgi:hypothetical protein
MPLIAELPNAAGFAGALGATTKSREAIRFAAFLFSV